MVEQQEYRAIMGRDDPNSEWGDLVNRDLPEVLPESFSREGEILSRPDENNPAPMRISDLAFKGYAEVWNTVTGERCLQPKWLLWQTMLKKHPDGKPFFTLTDPRIAPSYGDDLKCPLHPASPDYRKLRGMGFRECRKGHIPNQAALNAHLSKSHKSTWAYLEQSRLDRIREEDRQIQRDAIAANREMLAAMSQAAVRGITAPAPEIKVPSRQSLFDAACPDCSRSFSGKSRKQAQQRVGLHQRSCLKKTDQLTPSGEELNHVYPSI